MPLPHSCVGTFVNDLQCNPNNVYSEVGPVEFSRAYTQVRIAALGTQCFRTFVCNLMSILKQIITRMSKRTLRYIYLDKSVFQTIWPMKKDGVVVCQHLEGQSS